jgi:hypothetical protein
MGQPPLGRSVVARRACIFIALCGVLALPGCAETRRVARGTISPPEVASTTAPTDPTSSSTAAPPPEPPVVSPPAWRSG